MPRHSYKRIQPNVDPVYNSFEIAKLINYLMYDGKKTVASQLVYKTMEELEKTEKDALGTLHKAIVNATPDREVRARRLGGASYLVPTEVRSNRKLHLALNWILEGARARSNKEFPTFDKKLTAEIVEASKNQGYAISKKEQTEKTADQNKAFSHLKW
jgi:small subunit ribosomal protein S7